MKVFIEKEKQSFVNIILYHHYSFVTNKRQKNMYYKLQCEKVISK